MVGGILRQVRKATYGDENPRETLRLLVQGTGCESREYLVVHVAPTNYQLRPGDSIWWQGPYVFWTASPHGKPDVKLEKIGWSTQP